MNLKKAGYALMCSLVAVLAFVLVRTEVIPHLSSESSSADMPVTELYSEEDYLQFVRSLRAGNTYEGDYVNLYCDLDLAGLETEWDLEGVVFDGIFDGNGHTICNSGLARGEKLELPAGISGLVCNLAIKDDRAEAGESRVLSVEVLEAGMVLNCSSDVDFASEGQAGLLFNCVLPETERAVGELNENLSRCAFYGQYQPDAWNLWENQDGKSVLISEKADTLVSIEAFVSLENGEDTGRTLVGYYSDDRNAWCVALPSGWGERSVCLYLTFTDQDTQSVDCGTTEREKEIEKSGIHYKIQILVDENTPALFLDTDTLNSTAYLAEDKSNQLSGSWTLTDAAGETEDSGKLKKLRGHGNDSFSSPKISYNLEFSKEVDLLGTGAAERYVLMAGYRENSLLSYKVTNDLARSVEMDYAPKTRFVQLYIDGNYMGMYFLTGRIEIGENRFNLRNLEEETKNCNGEGLRRYPLRQKSTESGLRVYRELSGEPEDISGGYILERDAIDYDPEKSRFVSSRGWSLVLRSLSCASEKEVDYIADYWQDFEDALYAEDGYNEKGVYYTDYIDLTSFADQWIFYELNTEVSMGSSIYYYKESDTDGDGLLHACYPWDMEHSLRSINHVTAGWIGRPGHGRGSKEDFWVACYEHEDFAREVLKEWEEKFLPVLTACVEKSGISDEEGLASLDWYEQEYAVSGELNQSRWSGCDYQDKIEKIRDIYTRRKDFLSKRFALYDSGYTWIYEEDGVLYGMGEDEEVYAIEDVWSDEENQVLRESTE